MSNADPVPRFGMHCSALVALQCERAALAAVLVLQEMGLAVDIAVDRDRSVDWAKQAGYSFVVCGGDDDEAGVKGSPRRCALRCHRRACSCSPAAASTAPEWRRWGSRGPPPPPVEVNSLVDPLWPATAA